MTPPVVLRRVDAALFADGTARRLAMLRVGLATIMLLRLATWPYAQLAATPPVMFRPPTLLTWAAGYPSARTLIAIQVIGSAAAIWSILRARSSGASWLSFTIAWISFLALSGFKTSTGKVLHNDVLLLLVCVPAVLCRARARLGERRASPDFGWPVRTALVITAIVYFVCGLQKLRHSGFAWVTSDNMQWILVQAIDSGRAPTTALSAAIVNHRALWIATALGLIALELTFPIVLVWRRARHPYAAAAVALHVGTWLTLGLDYWAWSLTALLVLGLSGLQREDVEWSVNAEPWRRSTPQITLLAPPAGFEPATHGLGRAQGGVIA